MSKHLVIEIQTFDTGAVTTQTWAYDTQLSAEVKYHTILASAAGSALPEHAAVLMTSDGYGLESKCYKHEVAPEPEPEPETA